MKNKRYEIIIFEGCNCSGKTTLQKSFDQITNYSYVNLDRFLISDLIYNNVFNRHGDDYKYYIENICNRLQNEFNVLFVILHPRLNVVINRFKNRGHWLIKEDQLKKIYNEYSRFVSVCKSDNILVLRGNDVNKKLKTLLNKIKVNDNE